MRTTIDLPNDLYRRVKLRAAMRGGSIREFVIDCLQRGLEEDGPQPLTDAATQLERRAASPVPGSTIQPDEDGWPVIARSEQPDSEKA
ncbi:MAG: hypothetical protein EA428_14105 [Spirochaetaceae bacterium]|nr:MAG: hypothetical protein EA428_14105 [Spirochaetaceae bacterium]